MPIITKDFVWSQTDSEILLRLPLKGVNKRNVNVFASKDYIKINYNPFFFEAFLLHPIKNDESKCKIMKNEITFNIIKSDSIQWETLTRIVNKEEKLQLKNEIIKDYQEEEELRRKERAKYREEKKRGAIDREIRRSTAVRTSIEQLEKNVFHKEMSAVSQLKEKVASTSSSSIRSAPKAICGPESAAPVLIKSKPKPENKIPAVRQSGNIEVNFTKRTFVTPQRESQVEQEKEWLLRQSEAKKIIGFVEDDLRPEERNPEWLKEKGDDFFKKKNYLAAISAYTTGIRLTDKYYQLFLNRSAAQFAIGNYQRCIEDCTKALELLQPAVSLNLHARKQSLARRGAALCKIGYLRSGYDEITAALKLEPEDVALKADAAMIKNKLENDVSSDDEPQKEVYIDKIQHQQESNLNLSKDNVKITEGKLSDSDSDSTSEIEIEIIE